MNCIGLSMLIVAIFLMIVVYILLGQCFGFKETTYVLGTLLFIVIGLIAIFWFGYAILPKWLCAWHLCECV